MRAVFIRSCHAASGLSIQFVSSLAELQQNVQQSYMHHRLRGARDKLHVILVEGRWSHIGIHILVKLATNIEDLCWFQAFRKSMHFVTLEVPHTWMKL